MLPARGTVRAQGRKQDHARRLCVSRRAGRQVGLESGGGQPSGRAFRAGGLAFSFRVVCLPLRASALEDGVSLGAAT